MARPGRARGVLAVTAAVVLSAHAWIDASSSRGPDRAARLRSLQAQIDRLEQENAAIEQREQGVLTELDRTRAELALSRARLEETDLRLEEIREAVTAREDRIDRLAALQAERRDYLAMRVRQLYREGPSRTARIVLASDDIESYLAGLRYAAWLGANDRDTLRSHRLDARRVQAERVALAGERDRLEAVRRELVAARAASDRAADRQASLLERLREDRAMRRAAVAELDAAARSLAALVDAAPSDTVRPDVERFRGLLDAPVEGAITVGFGDVVHPRFKTRVPHPGVDFAADEGAPFHAVFEARVLFAGWLRGYGLTAILDHGHGAVTVYAHASALVVEQGESVLRGQKLGYVGATGSTTGPHLYFELRRGGSPVDPEPWFR